MALLESCFKSAFRPALLTGVSRQVGLGVEMEMETEERVEGRVGVAV